MSTSLSASFLRAVVLLTGFKPKAMIRVEAAVLLIGLRAAEFTAAEIPGELTNGNKHIAGAACGALCSAGLIECVRRIKSPDPKAKGRKLDVWRIPSGKRETARAWLRANQITEPLQESTERTETAQMEMVIA